MGAKPTPHLRAAVASNTDNLTVNVKSNNVQKLKYELQKIIQN